MNLTSFLQDKKLTIILKGEIDHHMAKETMRLIGEKVEAYLPMVCILDYKNVSFMDSSGIAVILFTLRKMRELDGENMLVFSNIGFWQELRMRKMPHSRFLFQSDRFSFNQLVRSSVLPCFTSL